MRNLKATVQYDGTNYCGFQAQIKQGSPTIQETLEKTLSELCGEKIVISGSGRTDSGVHALGQIVSFQTHSSIPVERAVYAANRLLPRDIAITALEEVDERFHARKSALGKYYQYNIYNGQTAIALGSNYFYWVPYQLDEGLIREGCKMLEGTHNFASFCASGTSVRSFERTLYYSHLNRQGDWWQFNFYGTGFLRNMVRIMIGTLVDVGSGRKDLQTISRALAGADRTLAGRTAPARGLFLKCVYYP